MYDKELHGLIFFSRKYLMIKSVTGQTKTSALVFMLLRARILAQSTPLYTAE
jgi:hypothetical protein